MMTVAALRRALAQPSGMGSIQDVSGGAGLAFVDTDTGHTLSPRGDGTFIDPVIPAILDSNGRVVVTSSQLAAAASSGGSDGGGPSAADVAAVGGALAQLGNLGLNIANTVTGRGPAPAPAPRPAAAPSAPLSTGVKVALGVGGALVVEELTLGIIRKMLSPKKRRRR